MKFNETDKDVMYRIPIARLAGGAATDKQQQQSATAASVLALRFVPRSIFKGHMQHGHHYNQPYLIRLMTASEL